MIGLEELGLTQEEIQERLIDKMASKLMEEYSFDEDGDRYSSRTNLASRLTQAIQKRLDEGLQKLAEKHVLPNVEGALEGLILQKTNQYGEKKGKSVTFIEYLVGRAEQYMHEKVDYDGKSQSESRFSHFDGKQTRITHLVNKHLHYSIASAMEKALQTANSNIVKGLEETVKIKLAEIQKSLKVEVKTGR